MPVGRFLETTCALFSHMCHRLFRRYVLGLQTSTVLNDVLELCCSIIAQQRFMTVKDTLC